MVVAFGSNQYEVIHYGVTDTELEVYIPQTAAKKADLEKQATGQDEISLKNDDGTVFKTVLGFTTLKDGVKETVTATQEGNVDCYRLVLAKSTPLAADVLTNKANIEYIAAMSDVEL